ncbi:MAG: SusD/RagB family nutrient-binding outer membrane lipoprotein [Ginsengibacter sp.]
MKKILIISILIIVTVFSNVGCKKYLDINANPNATENPPIPGLLANVTSLTANNSYDISDFVSYYVQYLASPSAGSSTDTYQQIDPSGTWGDVYNVLTDLYDMRNFAVAKGWKAYEGVADILTACNLSMASNIWGNMPYSEAFIGVKNLTPKYDDQKALYDTCLFLLNRGIATMQTVTNADQFDGGSDFIHAGNARAWVKTGYALQARLLNEVSKTSQYDPTKVLAAIDSAYMSNKDDAQVTQFTVNNPWNAEAISNANLVLNAWLSAYFVNATNGNIYGVFDPRLPEITNATDSGKYAGVFYPAGFYRGTPNGAGYQGTRNTDDVQNYLDVDKWYSSTNSPLQIITNAECRFIESEAAFRANNMDRAYSAYIAGITASMNKLEVPADSITKYLNNPAVSVGKTNLTLKLIMKEKYVACFLMPVTWDDMRRFDYNYKGFALPQNADLDTFIRRADYPSSATSRNGKNVPAWTRTDHLWWDQ